MFEMTEVQKAGSEDELKEEYEAREYQINLLSIVLNENTILYLPTGSGKTFVAVMLIKCLSQDLEKPYGEGGQRTFFAVNTVALVKQQGDYIARHTHLKVGKYSGDLNVDNWDAGRWDTELKNNQVIVLTCQILLDMLQHGFVKLENINLIIFDECHHAVYDHCMRRVMQKFENCPKKLQPRVLGLSATLLNGNCKSEKVVKEIRGLESTFQAKVATVDDINQVKQFSTNPQEETIIFVEGYPLSAATCIESLKGQVLTEIETAKNILKSIKPSVFSNKDDGSPTITHVKKLNEPFGVKEKKRLLAILNDVKIMVEDLGLFGGNWAVLSAFISLHRRRLAVETENGKIIITGLITHMILIRRMISKEMDKYSPLDQIYKFSTCKILKLLEMLRENENPCRSDIGPISLREQLESNNKSPDSKSCALIFVERRQTAKTLYHILKAASMHYPGLKSLVPEFVVGVAANPASAESSLMNKRHHEAIKKFRSGECNYLIASDVMEEGVDIPQCALVVKLDLPKTFRSYVQSKGRARHSTSRYVMFVPSTNDKFWNQLKEFRKVEEQLKQILIGKTDERRCPTEEEVRDQLYLQEIPPYYSEDGTASVNTTSAVALINRYCSLLPQDKFTQLYPLWLLDNRVRILSSNKLASPVYRRLAYLQLPINSPLRDVVKGIPMENKRLAKRAVALMACVALHRIGELGNDLLPVSHGPEMLDDSKLFPHWKNEGIDDGVPGSKKRKRLYSKQVAEFLTGCHPKPNTTTYVHHIFQKPVYEEPNDSRGRALYNVLNMNRGYAIISSKDLPQVHLDEQLYKAIVARKIVAEYCRQPLSNDVWQLFTEKCRSAIIDDCLRSDGKFQQHLATPCDSLSARSQEVCDFPIFMSSGEVAVKIGQNESVKEVILTLDDIKVLEEFHYMIFFYLLKICKQHVVVDNSYTTNSYLIAPTCTDDSGKWVIDWDTVRNFPQLPPIEPLTEDEVNNLTVNNNNFLYQVVTPWYRGNLTERHYVVTKVCDDMDARSRFPSLSYESFEKYFEDKYELTLLKPELPLLEVKAISSRIDCIHPRGTSVTFDDTPQTFPMSKRQMILKQGDFNEHLIPEFVTQRKFPATLWLKATTLPTVLHRLSCMLLAYELRTQICFEAKTGSTGPPLGEKWRPLEVELSNVKEEESHRATTAVTAEFFADSGCKSTLCSDQELIDLDREIEKLSLLDVMQYKLLDSKENDPPIVNNYEWHCVEPAKVPPKVLNRLCDNATSESSNLGSLGPELADVLSAITGASSGDVFNLERLETLGDSFLKFAASTYLFLKYPKIDEGKLTVIKGRMISNRNLLYCGEKKHLGEKIKAHPFAPNSDWNPPGFTVPTFLKEKLSDHGGITNDVLFKLIIPEADRRSGQLSRETKSDIVESLKESKTNNTIGKMSSTLEALLGKQSVPDKSVADCVEALIGSWLLTGGSSSALRLLGWFGILPQGPTGPAGTWEELIGHEALISVKDGYIKDQKTFGIIGGVVDWGPNFQNNSAVTETPQFNVEGSNEEHKPDEKEKDNGNHESSNIHIITTNNVVSDAKLTERNNCFVEKNHDKEETIERIDESSETSNMSMLEDEDKVSYVNFSEFVEENQHDEDEFIARTDVRSDTENMSMLADEDELSYVEFAEESDYEHHSDEVYSYEEEWDDEITDSSSNNELDLEVESEDSLFGYPDYDLNEKLSNESHDGMSSLQLDGESDDENIFSNHSKRRKLSPTFPRIKNIKGKALQKDICKNSICGQKPDESDQKIKNYLREFHSKRELAIKMLKSSFTINTEITRDGLSSNSIEELLPGAASLEEIINYRFKNRCLLLQALTHASYHPNRVTECYQRLEFLGDAVLDYVITCHIFETCGKLSPGQLTDLRSALVNNITFASIVVRYGIHRHLLHLSPSLMEILDSFVDFQVQRNHAVTEECLVLLEEEECKLAESVEVPKALGDVLESLAGAIFLDSGFSLTTVWGVFYPMMKKEIDAFSKKVPKQPVRELLESNADVTFLPSKPVLAEIASGTDTVLSKSIVMIPVEVRDKKTGKLKTFYGFGERKSLAKRAAAKLALKAMGKS